ncbi:MAG: glycosyltransferase [Planctomycetales bacterium]|nr:glycosyltransferase [Planctomycetales bacterium]
MTESVDVSVVIPTFRRHESLRTTLQAVGVCDPAPQEILVHIDFGDNDTELFLRREFPAVRVLRSDRTLGPGGARNRLIAAAEFECVVSLDDDSWPTNSNFFALAKQTLADHPNAGVVACDIHEKSDPKLVSHQSNPLARECQEAFEVQSFVGCGTILRKNAFLKTKGYLPLRFAYGMEELDVSLQLLDLGYDILKRFDLQVYHDCDRDQHHADPRINAAQIRNTALLAFLRYPVRYFPLGVLQTANRVLFAVRKGRWAGIAAGVFSTSTILGYFHLRAAVSVHTLSRFRRLALGTKRNA